MLRIASYYKIQGLEALYFFIFKIDPNLDGVLAYMNPLYFSGFYPEEYLPFYATKCLRTTGKVTTNIMINIIYGY